MIDYPGTNRRPNMIEQYMNSIKKSIKVNTIIYGAGKVGKIVLGLCKSNGVMITGFAVRDKAGNPDEIEGIKVQELKDIALNPDDTLVLIAVKELGEHKIIKYLKNQGWENVIDIPDNILDLDTVESDRKKRPALEITPKAGCEVNCKFCPQQLFLSQYFKDNKRRSSMMCLEEYKVVLRKLPKNTLIEFAGFVEPFLNPEGVEMITYTHEQGFEMTLFTTLRGLTLESFNKIKNIPFHQVVLHTPDIKEYANIPITDEYLEVLDAVLEAKREDGRPFVDSANCQSAPHPTILEHTQGKLKIYCELIDRAGNLEGDEEQQLSSAERKGEIYCDRANNLDHFVLLPDGTVVLCCNDFGMQHVLGNLLTDSYESIIHGEPMRDVKRAMKLDDRVPLICRKCVYAIEKK